MTDAKVELLPCPFCGKKDNLIILKDGGIDEPNQLRVWGCPHANGMRLEQWNKRIPSPKPQKQTWTEAFSKEFHKHYDGILQNEEIEKAIQWNLEFMKTYMSCADQSQKQTDLVPLDEKLFREWLKSHHCPDCYIEQLAPEFILKFGQSAMPNEVEEMRSLIDGCYELVELFKPESHAQTLWKNDWLANARKHGASGE